MNTASLRLETSKKKTILILRRTEKLHSNFLYCMMINNRCKLYTPDDKQSQCQINKLQSSHLVFLSPPCRTAHF